MKVAPLLENLIKRGAKTELHAVSNGLVRLKAVPHCLTPASSDELLRHCGSGFVSSPGELELSNDVHACCLSHMARALTSSGTPLASHLSAAVLFSVPLLPSMGYGGCRNI